MLDGLFTVTIDKVNELVITAQGKFEIGSGCKDIIKRKNIKVRLVGRVTVEVKVTAVSK